eukprot:c28729_g2_i1 orf=404-2848(-)
MSGPYSWSFEADRIGSQVPVKLMHLEGLYELFLSKVGFSAPDSALDFNVNVRFTMRLTYGTSMLGFEYIQSDFSSSPSVESIINYEADVSLKVQWDEQFPWAEWYTVDDPIKGFELITIWASRMVGGPFEMAEFENISTFESDKWLLQPLLVDRLNCDQQDEQVSFAARLLALVTAFSVSKEAQFMEDFAAADKPGIEKFLLSATVPPPGVLDRVLKELFHQGPILSTSENHACHQHAKEIKGAPTNSLFAQFCLQALWFGTCNIHAIAVLWIEFVREVRWCWEELQPLPRVSPDQSPDLDTCLVNQKLHLLAACIKRKSAEQDTFNIPGDTGKSESKTSVMTGTQMADSEDTFDIGTNVAAGIPVETSYSLSRDSNNSIKIDPDIVGLGMDSGIVAGKDSTEEYLESECKQQLRESVGLVDHMMLLKTGQKLHVPMTQDPPIMTEDMMMEREQALVALSNSPSGKIALSWFQSDILGADMSAFKAANPGSMLEDFIRWYSPQDCIKDDQDEEDKDILGVTPDYRKHENLEGSLSTTGRLLKRMSEPGNAWEQIWRNADAVPASEEKPLFDHTREGEKVIHYLETLRPHHLLSQMVCTAFGATADILFQTKTAKLRPLLVELDQLYLTIASILKPLRSINISDKELISNMEEWHSDIAELCKLFEEVEMDVIIAASLCQKLPQTQRLSSSLLQEYMHSKKQEKNYTFGASSMDNTRKIYQMVSRSEREKVAETLFPPLSSSETWRKSIRMGNFLNGHEPSLREVIFSHFDDFLQDQKETYRDENANSTHALSNRMYIKGTSNDLQVAYSLILND